MKSARVLVIRADGTVSAEWTTLAELLGPYAGRYRLVEGSPGTLVLQSVDPDNEQRGRVLGVRP